MQTLDYSSVKERVLEIVRKNSLFNADKVNENSVLRVDHGIDSIRLVEMVVDLEDEFNIEVDTTSLSYENFANIELIIKYVMSKLSIEV
jgi:acyl carrier protein